MIGAHSINQHRKCSSHHSRSWIFQCVLEMGFSQPHIQTQQWQKGHFLSIGSFRSWGRALFTPSCYSWWHLGPSCWTGDQKQSMGWHHPQSVSLEGKIRNLSFSEQGYNHCLLGVWISDLYRCNAKRGEYHLWCLHHDADRSQESFRTSSASQDKSSFRMTLQDNTHVWRLRKLLQNLVGQISRAPKPRSSTLRFLPVSSLRDAIHSTQYDL